MGKVAQTGGVADPRSHSKLVVPQDSNLGLDRSPVQPLCSRDDPGLEWEGTFSRHHKGTGEAGLGLLPGSLSVWRTFQMPRRSGPALAPWPWAASDTSLRPALGGLRTAEGRRYQKSPRHLVPQPARRWGGPTEGFFLFNVIAFFVPLFYLRLCGAEDGSQRLPHALGQRSPREPQPSPWPSP